MDLDTRVKLAVFHHFAGTGTRPTIGQVADAVSITPDAVCEAFARLFKSRVLVLEADGETIRMAPPFSGIPTQHLVRVAGKEYFANCAWDALAIPAALRTSGTIESRCEQSGEPLRLDMDLGRPPLSDWLFHCPVPAVHWWKDIVFT